MVAVENTGETTRAATIAIAIARCVSDAVIVADGGLRIVGVNQSAAEVLGERRETLLGADLADAMCGEGQQPEWFTRLVDRPDDQPSRPIVLQTSAKSRFRAAVSVRATRVESCVVIAASMLGGGDLQARQRIADLEAGLRSIGWELEALGVGVGGDPADPAPLDALRELSRREREVLDAFLTGASVAETAGRLHLSEHTVRSHLKAIYRKLGVRGQTELMRRLTRRT